MKDNFLTKQEFEDFRKKDFKESVGRLEESFDKLKEETTKNTVLLEDIRDSVKAIAEMTAG